MRKLVQHASVRRKSRHFGQCVQCLALRVPCPKRVDVVARLVVVAVLHGNGNPLVRHFQIQHSTKKG